MARPAESIQLGEGPDLLSQLQIDRSAVGTSPLTRRTKQMLISAVSVAAIAALVSYYFWPRAASAVAVSTFTVRAGASGAAQPTAVLQASGYVAARRQATVSTQITGMLTSILFEEGDHVTAGQLLAQLDSRAQAAALLHAKANVRAAQAVLEQHSASLLQATRDLRRTEQLVASQLVSSQALETAQTQLVTTQAQVTSQHRQIELAQAAVEASEVQLSNTRVLAPFDGVIIAKAAQPGEIVSPMSAGGGFTRSGVGTIVDMDSLEIEVDVNEASINRVQPAQRVDAVLDAYPDWHIPAHVVTTVPSADRSKATVKVRIAFDQKDPRILPDMGAKVSFFRPDEDSNGLRSLAEDAGLLVPVSAIVKSGEEQQVFVVKDGRAHAKRIKAGEARGDHRLVEGLTSNTVVVISPPPELKDGDPVARKE